MRVIATVFFAVAINASPVAGAAFTGRWVADLSSQKLPDHPDTYLIKDGLYACRSCSPPRVYPADGKPHRVPGDQEVQSEAVTVISPRSIKTRIVSPSLIRETTMTVSPDDRRATYVSLDRRPDVKGTLKTRYIAERIQPAPLGAHRISGSWRGLAYLEVPKQVRTIVLRVAGDVFAYSTPTNVHFVARVNGRPALVHGPYAGVIKSSVQRRDARTLVEFRERDGISLFDRTYHLSRDGKALVVSVLNKDNGTTFASTYYRD